MVDSRKSKHNYANKQDDHGVRSLQIFLSYLVRVYIGIGFIFYVPAFIARFSHMIIKHPSIFDIDLYSYALIILFSIFRIVSAALYIFVWPVLVYQWMIGLISLAEILLFPWVKEDHFINGIPVY